MEKQNQRSCKFSGKVSEWKSWITEQVKIDNAIRAGKLIKEAKICHLF
ncbi:MAG: hypothetical protein FWE23_08975 [Chitinivibrionia bacterium]|nr:hypothetical protein [Chitinivibrionia bacterium]